MLLSIKDFYCFYELNKLPFFYGRSFGEYDTIGMLCRGCKLFEFFKAAQQLRLSQPAVSHQINTLEDELGVKLFHRTSKSVRLTQEGYLFLRYAGEILKLSGISKARVNDLQRVAGKRLVIGCRNVPEMRLLKPALRALRVAEPETMPVLQLIPFDSMANLLNDGDIHLLFSFGNPGIPKRVTAS